MIPAQNNPAKVSISMKIRQLIPRFNKANLSAWRARRRQRILFGDRMISLYGKRDGEHGINAT
jgi:hypothetical protein